MMAGSSGMGGLGFSLAGSSMRRSFTSLPRNMIWSYTTSEGGYSSLPLLRPSVPYERTLSNETVDCSELISTSVPTYLSCVSPPKINGQLNGPQTYRISLLEMRDIRDLRVARQLKLKAR